ncbi:MAG: DNA repair protein RecN [Clostridia bacterium]|nr:DNA repair protein RecN [Clostridia bacterium]
MLNKLTIKNIALIECVEIDFSNGLNVLSGETGAGKSVILESLNFVLGAKADKTLIRNSANECEVVAEFDISSCKEIRNTFNEVGFDYDDNLIISRKYTLDGKNTIRLNGNIVNVGMLKKFTSQLVDVHGQSEHYDLLNVNNQLKLLDNYAGLSVFKIKEEIKPELERLKQINNELTALGGVDDSQRLIKLDILNYQIKEINDVNLKEGEEEELLSIREKLVNQEKILTSLNSVKDSLSSEGGVFDILSNSIRSLNGIVNLSKDYEQLSERLNNLFAESDDLESEISSKIEEIDLSDFNLDEVETRLEQIKNLKKKYGNSFEEITDFLNNALKEKEKLDNFSQIASALLNEKNNLSKNIYDKYVDLSNERKKASDIFCEKVISELFELGMTKAKFIVKYADKPSLNDCKFDSVNGYDNLEFYFSANLGEEVKPLSNVISGGEMSRFMLAIKAQSAKYNNIPTYIFDEIDAGISGVIARVVAEKLIKISKGVQIIAISHLPQISAFADNNLLITKTEFDDKTITSVKKLNENEKIEEIIRLVGGEKNSESAIAHAKTLINSANEFKKSI